VKNAGYVYLTAFIEENVPDVVENPENYLGVSSGRLHRVRYEKGYFASLVKKAGFRCKEFLPKKIVRTGQSVVILNKS
jgi:hypothetical protein